MKKIITLVLFLLTCVIVNAQVTIKPHFGLNFSVLTSDVIDYENPAMRVGWLLGVGVKIGEDFYFEPGVDWTYNSFELVHENDQSLDHVSIIKGLRVPLMAGYQFGADDAPVRFRIFAGPTATFVLGVHDEGGANVPEKDDINSMMWGANGGIGLDILFAYIEVSYQTGLNNYYSNTDTYGTGKQNVLCVALGVNL